MQTYDLPQTAELIDAFRGTRMQVPVLLAVLLRDFDEAGLAAVRWKNVDLDRAQIGSRGKRRGKQSRWRAIQGAEKRSSAHSRAIRNNRSRSCAPIASGQARGIVTPRRAAFWRGTSSCAQADETRCETDQTVDEWVRLLAGTTLPRVRLHKMRHTHASHMLAANVHPKIVQERLGHSSIAITLDIYSAPDAEHAGWGSRSG